MGKQELAEVQAALGHIVTASTALTRMDLLRAATALRAGWLSDSERAALADLAAGFDRLSTAGAPREEDA